MRVYVSSGLETVIVPTLEGLGEDAARAALTTAQLAAGSVTPRNDPDLAAGTVLSSDPAVGTVSGSLLCQGSQRGPIRI